MEYMAVFSGCVRLLFDPVSFPENDADTSPAAQVVLSVPSRAGGGAVRL